MEDIRLETMEEENKDALRELAENAYELEREAWAEYERIAEEEDFDIDDSAFIERVRTYDRARAKRSYMRIAKIAAVFVISIITIGAVGLAKSEAFRMRFFSLLYDKDAGGVAIRAEDQELLKGWSSYWYPTVLPEGYQLVYAEKMPDGPHAEQVYSAVESEGNFFITQLSLNVGYNHDTEHHSLEQLSVNGHDAYYITAEDKDHTEIITLFDNAIVNINVEWDAGKDEMLEYARGLKYIEK